MAKFSQLGVFSLTFFALLTGVMAETIDGSLIGVVVATVCVVLLLFAIIALAVYCGCRRVEKNRRHTKERKHSGISSSTAPRWAPPMMPSAIMPMYTVPEPMMYAVPQNYYLGHYTPKFVDADAMEYMSRVQYDRGGYEESYSWRDQEVDDPEIQVQVKKLEIQTNGKREEEVKTATLVVETSPDIQEQPQQQEQQPNGHVVHEFIQSSDNYKVIRKQHKHEKMPEWLTKDYDENEKSMIVEDEASISSSDDGSVVRHFTPETTPVQAVRAQVSQKDSTLDSDEVLHVSPDYTIIDYVDPEQPTSTTTTTAYRLSTNDDSTVSGGFRVTSTEITTTTTRTQQVVDTSQGSVSTDIPPASTSTPRVPTIPTPPPPPPPPPPLGLAMKGPSDSDDEHRRMRRRGQGSVEDLPTADVQF